MKKTLLSLLLFSSLNIFAQYEAAHWFFGSHAGLDFTQGAPVPEHGGQINTEEGCSSISSPCGDLILYTDGKTVWDANHHVMPNGTNLFGDSSSSQSGIVVPKPDDLSKYYIFTVDDAYISLSEKGMRYSLVDMNLNNGMGDIVAGEKNVELVEKSSEKVTAVSTDNWNTIWVLTFAPSPAAGSPQAPYHIDTNNTVMNTFYAFKVTRSGVDMEAVISTLPINILGGAGYMKVSPDGSKIVIANLNDENAYIMDFNKSTGEVSNPVALNFPWSNPAPAPYGVEFSSNSSKLYISDRENKLTQFDLNNNNASLRISTHQNYRSALQLASDGKIYQTHTISYSNGSPYLSVIENPNELGPACNYRYKSIRLPSGMEAHQGLPPFIQSYFTLIGSDPVSANINNTLEINSSSEIISVYWDFGDGTTGTSYPDNPPVNDHSEIGHTYLNPGTYLITITVELTIGCSVTIQQEFYVPDNISDQYFCFDNQGVTIDLSSYDDDIIALQNTSGPFEIHYYANLNDALNEVNELSNTHTFFSNEEIYYSVIDTSNNFNSIGFFHLILYLSPVINTALTPYEVCDSDTDGFAVFDLSTKVQEILGTQTNPPYEVHFYPTQADAENDSNEITNITDYTNQTPYQETVWARTVNTDTGCFSLSFFDLIVHPLPEIIMDDEYILCAGQTIQLDAPSGFTSYEWSTGETTQSIEVNTPGTYTVSVTDSNSCSNETSLNVIPSDVAVIESVLVKDFVGVNGNSITVNVSGPGDYEFSIDGINYQQSNTFSGLYPGTYTVYVSDKNGCGVVEKVVDLLGAPQYFTPNGDGNNDYWQIINVDKRKGTYVYIYDRYGKLMAKIDSNGPGWNGMYNGKPALSTDYWFSAQVKEDDGVYREVKGHFSLKR